MSSRVSNSVYAHPLVILFVTLLNLARAAANYGGNETDSFALLAFKSNLHDPQGVLGSWNHSVHFCAWQGVTCGRLHRRVTVLNLPSSGLAGSLSPFIGNLSFLKEIVLQNNSFQGEIPIEIGHLFRLKSLWLFSNSLEGKIPTNLSHCTSLIVLDVTNNKLVGEIPRELGSLSKLKTLAISFNNLSGEIPSIIRNLSSLEYLYALQNDFEGSIPNTLGELRNLKEIQLGGNKLSGIVPSSIYNLSLLNFLALAGNELGGSLQQNLGLSLPHLQELQMWGNLFNGTIPLSLSNASDLAIIGLQYNYFTGKVPTGFGSLKNLTSLGLDYNYLGTGEGGEMNILINSLTNCSLLFSFSVIENNLGGTIPNSLGNISTQLREFGIGSNRISGVIPLGFGKLVNLERIGMEYNEFEGQIPDDIGKLQKLYMLNLSSNQLSGQIPLSLGNMSLLSIVSLENNTFEGTIPSSLGNCKNLLFLNLSRNNLSGAIPKELFSASSLSNSIILANNHLIGPIPSEVGKLKNLVQLDVSENWLSGEIPTELGSCSSLKNLYLGGNFFHGSIPPSFKSLRSFQNLDLSNNNLSGRIPIFLENFPLESLNVSFNDFEGELPTQGVFANASTISVVGNSGLCGGISELRLPKCNIAKSNRRRLSRVHIIIIIVGCLLPAVSMVALLLVCWTKKKRREQSSGSFLKESFLKVSYGDLVKATNGFSSTNIIGVGGFGTVYKGILDQDEIAVAIKVLDLQCFGASKSFMAECKALRNIRHRNLVKIITSCSSIDFNGNDFKALVYEFMANGSLESWLHLNQDTENGTDESRKLNLHQRISIAIDVACAIHYLHHECGKTIIHCDLKPSNVLLDVDMVAHVGDFGLARFAILEPSDANQSRSVGVKGTVGYAAPEYGLGNEVSMNGDVYSYGILLLEMITGKSPTNRMFNEGHSLHNYARMALPNNVMEIVDPKLRRTVEEDVASIPANNQRINSEEHRINGSRMEDCLFSVVKIGVACSLELPQDRMDLGDVIRQLESIKSTLGGS